MTPYNLGDSQLAKDLDAAWNEVAMRYSAGELFGAIKALGVIGAEILGVLTLIGGMFALYTLSTRNLQPYQVNMMMAQFSRLGPQLVNAYANLSSDKRRMVIKLLHFLGIKPTTILGR